MVASNNDIELSTAQTAIGFFAVDCRLRGTSEMAQDQNGDAVGDKNSDAVIKACSCMDVSDNDGASKSHRERHGHGGCLFAPLIAS